MSDTATDLYPEPTDDQIPGIDFELWPGQWADEAREEVWAESAWLRAAEAGTPDTWAETERDLRADAFNYGQR